MQELASGYGLIEGPVWDDKRGLIFSDVINGGVFCIGLVMRTKMRTFYANIGK